MTAPAGVPAFLLPHFFAHYGVYVSFIGEDDQLVALGHHGNQRAVIAAFNRHAQVDVGLSASDDWKPLVEDVSPLDRVWAVETTGDTGDEWRLFLHVPADMGDAIPVTVPACCQKPLGNHGVQCLVGMGIGVEETRERHRAAALAEIARNR